MECKLFFHRTNEDCSRQTINKENGKKNIYPCLTIGFVLIINKATVQAIHVLTYLISCFGLM